MKFLIGLLLLSANLYAGDEEYKCDFEGINSVEVAVHADRVNSKKATYKYQIVGNLDPDKMVIIYLPGGPGGSSMNDYRISEIINNKLRNDLPADVPWIMIDPRTVGCNRGNEAIYPDDSLTSENVAHDVLSVIESLKLKKYVLYGHSYGSQHATFVAGLAGDRGITAPHALFVSGILGRGETDGSLGISHNLILQWNLIRATLSPEALKVLDSTDPLGVSDYKWRKVIKTGLYDGNFMIGGVLRNPLMELFAGLENPDSPERKKLMDQLNFEDTGPYYGQSDFSERLFAKVDCHEFSPKDGGVEFEKGFLIPGYDPCEKETFDRPYDSAKFEIKSPIYYLAGTADPAAPYSGARYHFENQTSAQRNFITMKGGGHTKMGWIFQDCKDEMWQAIFALKNLDEVLTKCKVEVDLEIR